MPRPKQAEDSKAKVLDSRTMSEDEFRNEFYALGPEGLKAVLRGDAEEWDDAGLSEQQKALHTAIHGGDPAPLLHPLAGPFVRVGWDPPMALQLGSSSDGRLICTGVLVGWQLNVFMSDPAKVPMTERTEVTPSTLHDIRLGSILKDLAPLSLSDPTDWVAMEKQMRLSRRTKPAQRAMPLPDWFHQSLPVIARRRAPKDDEYFKEVAILCQRAPLARRDAPMEWLAERLHCSIATAHRRRKEAIKRGFLPERQPLQRSPRMPTSKPKRPKQKPTKRKASR
jgi:hypothetical protein